MMMIKFKEAQSLFSAVFCLCCAITPTLLLHNSEVSGKLLVAFSNKLDLWATNKVSMIQQMLLSSFSFL